MHGDITKKTKCWLVLPLFLNFLQSTYFLYACSRNSPPPNTRLEILLLSFIEYPLCLRNLVESQFSSVTQSCPTLCDPMDCSMPGLPVPYHLPEFAQTHVHSVGDVIQPSHPLPPPSPPSYLSQHQGLSQ